MGVGDCFLLTLPRGAGTPFRLLIDCGVHMAQKGGPGIARAVVADLKNTCGGRLDVVVATHEHWDHLSGFADAEDLWQGIAIGELWLPWTEDADDALAGGLRANRARALRALDAAAARMAAQGMAAPAALAGLLGFLGDTTGTKLQKAARVLRERAGTVRYRVPGEVEEFAGAGARAFVLGPPRDANLIARDKPREGEVYATAVPALAALEASMTPDARPPFDARFAVPLDGTREIDFFARRYWASESPDPAPGAAEDTGQGWRRIDGDWQDAATALALALDEDTNNTSLVLAVELGPAATGGPVLLFAADAQVGNWESWPDVRCRVGGRTVTGADLLRRTRVYKVGHHASHNATRRAGGLETMDALALALVPTDAAMAEKVGWGTLPWPALLRELAKRTGGRVLRTDQPAPARLDGFRRVASTGLYIEVEV